MQQLIYETLYRIATPVDGTTEEYATPEAARDAFIAKVMAALFPPFQMPVPAAESKTIVVAEPKKEKKARKPKEPAAAGAGTPKTKSPKTKSPKTETAVVEVPVVTQSPPKEKKAKKTKAAPAPAEAADVPLPESPKEKKKRAPKSEEEKAAAKAKKEAKKAAPAEEANLKKMDPTWKKHLKAIAKAQSKEVTKELEAELLGYLNSLTKEEFASKKAEEHVATFFYPQTASNAAAEEKVATDLEIVEFKGVDYFVNPETKRVYEGVGARDDDTGAYENYKAVGYVGMAAFEGMVLE
jgi:hypothetical protein